MDGNNVSGLEFLKDLLCLNIRASHLAQEIRAEEKLFELLVEEKGESEKNVKFAQDFKTLADVLIQEMVRHFVENKYPIMTGSVYGEESNKFEASVTGQKAVLDLGESKENLVENLKIILCGNANAASLLAVSISDPRLAECETVLDEVVTPEQQNDLSLQLLDLSKLGIWIDPIDSTNGYVSASKSDGEEAYQETLGGVTVLLGVFEIDSKEPVIGVVGKPFSSLAVNTTSGSKFWRSEYFWGINLSSNNFSMVCSSLMSLPPADPDNITIVLSSSEKGSALYEKLTAPSARNITLSFASGAGNKILKVAQGHVDLYITSGSGTYLYDTCAPDAMLRAVGHSSGILSLEKTLNVAPDILASTSGEQVLNKCFLEYERKRENNSNAEGIIVFRSIEALKVFLKLVV